PRAAASGGCIIETGSGEFPCLAISPRNNKTESAAATSRPQDCLFIGISYSSRSAGSSFRWFLNNLANSNFRIMTHTLQGLRRTPLRREYLHLTRSSGRSRLRDRVGLANCQI